MALRRFIAAVAGATVFALPALCEAQVTAPVYRDSAGQLHTATGVVLLNQSGTAAASSGGPTPVPTPTDGSGTITTAVTSQQVFPANTARVFLLCQNPTSATEPLFVNVAATAATTGGSYELAPGANFGNPPGVSLTGTINVTAATAGHRFICKQG